MSFKEALTTDISAGWIVGGAVAGGVLGGAGFAALSHFGIIQTASATTATASSLYADGDCNNEVTASYNALKMLSVRVTGNLGELASGITRTHERINSFTRTALYRVPDRLDHDLRILTEVKNVAILNLTNQIRDFAFYQSSEGYSYRLEIITRVTTKITPIMQRFIDEYRINILRIIE